MLTEPLLRRIMPLAGKHLDAHLPHIWPAMVKGRIVTPDRAAAFLSVLAHDSAEYRRLQENTDGMAYEGRVDLGNVRAGDGHRYKGHGPIPVIGRAAHRACGRHVGADAERQPRLLMQPEFATAAAVWVWTVGNGRLDLNLLADKGWFMSIGRVIGGADDHAGRRRYWDRTRALLDLPQIDVDGEAERKWWATQ